MVIIVTGAIGIGKTTVCQKLISLLRDSGYSVGGILTRKAGDEITVADLKTGESTTLASSRQDYHGPRTPKYFFNPEGIDFGTRAIERADPSTILVVDELGYLELGDEGFVKAIELIRNGKVKNSILVIRGELLPAFLPRLNAEPLVFEVTTDNRERLPREISALLVERLDG